MFFDFLTFGRGQRAVLEDAICCVWKVLKEYMTRGFADNGSALLAFATPEYLVLRMEIFPELECFGAVRKYFLRIEGFARFIIKYVSDRVIQDCI